MYSKGQDVTNLGKKKGRVKAHAVLHLITWSPELVLANRAELPQWTKDFPRTSSTLRKASIYVFDKGYVNYYGL